MSTSKIYQQSLVDVGSETRPPMLDRGSYIPWARDALLHYDAEIELMNLILLSIPNDIYNSVDGCTSAKDMWKRVECLMRGTIQNKVDRETRFTNEFDPFVAEPERRLVSDDVHTNSEDPLASAMLLLARAITHNFSNPTNNYLRTSSNTRNQAIIQGDRVNIQSRNSGNAGRNNRRAYAQEMFKGTHLFDLSKSKDKGSRSRSQSMNEQSHYKQDKTKTRQSINVKSHIFNVIGGTEEFEERDLNIGGDC
ncbi:hypothetical protein Tco_0894465 [Tanacetum coccineum]|uniref:Uncharacterized protein n=1 Tax=Tanacetum coccineum TaxID=301880 RepID=A0ABQ5CEH1_9ASTR